MDGDRTASTRRVRVSDGGQRRFPPVAGSTLEFGALTNDLERTVARRRPEIRAATRMMSGAGALTAAMTGSGSAVFGLFRRRARAVEAAGAARREGWTVLVTETVDRAGLARQVAV
jgi:4-diphosphocytidyl-2-C-methyl-D-erythritol kinase